jgi:hypothetical protein
VGDNLQDEKSCNDRFVKTPESLTPARPQTASMVKRIARGKCLLPGQPRARGSLAHK